MKKFFLTFKEKLCILKSKYYSITGGNDDKKDRQHHNV